MRRVEEKLNRRPHKVIDYKTPDEVVARAHHQEVCCTPSVNLRAAAEERQSRGSQRVFCLAREVIGLRKKTI